MLTLFEGLKGLIDWRRYGDVFADGGSWCWWTMCLDEAPFYPKALLTNNTENSNDTSHLERRFFGDLLGNHVYSGIYRYRLVSF
jgi:hypothetical protein